MTDAVGVEALISASLLRLRMRSPYFATLALFAAVEPGTHVETAATDGRTVFVNPAFLASLPSSEQDTLIVHNVIHAALLHVPRRGTRDVQLWNTACDVVVNGIIGQINGLRLPASAVRDAELEQWSVEEVYELLQRFPDRLPLTDTIDLLAPPLAGERGTAAGAGQSIDGPGRPVPLETLWRNARDQAHLLSLLASQGSRPTGLVRELGMLEPSRIDWRAYLWRYLVQTPTDFQGFDRRFIGRGLYLDALTGESVQIYLAVDTSGSIDEPAMQLLLGEIQGILSAYPHLKCALYYADAEVHGPYDLTASSIIPSPIGGGGTDFRPFFAAVEQQHQPFETAICIYLTDGYGQFPLAPPPLPVLWVVTAGGLALEQFPFGESVRLLATSPSRGIL